MEFADKVCLKCCFLFLNEDSAEMGGPYCGEAVQGKILLSPGNTIRMVFKTDESFALKGMTVKISFVPSGNRCSRVTHYLFKTMTD